MMYRFVVAVIVLAVGCSRPAPEPQFSLTQDSTTVASTAVAYSRDGRLKAFVRGTPRDTVLTALGYEQATELWVANADGSAERRLVRGLASDSVERTLAALSSPAFSLDGNRVYFLSRAWVTSDAVHAVDVTTGYERFIAPGNSIEIIPVGIYAGCLLVSQHRYREGGGGSYDAVYVLGVDGNVIATAVANVDASDDAIAVWKRHNIPVDTSVVRVPPNSRCN